MNKLFSLLRRVTAACVIAAFGVVNFAHADPLGIQIFSPRVKAFSGGGTCEYNAGTQTLTITGFPDQVEFDDLATNLGFVDFGALTISANIDGTGSLIAGTFTVEGETTDFNTFDFFPTPLLTGNIVAYGIAASGTTDIVDFRIQPTGDGGSLYARFSYGDQIGARVTLEGSSFADSFASNWGCATPKTIAGSIPPLDVETCALTLTKVATPDTIGPITPPPGYDKPDDSDVDSHHDSNNDGDSDSEDDSGSGTPVDCGCKGKVSELRLRYNGTVAVNVIVTRRPPHSTLLFSGTVLPASEFTVYGSNYGPPGFQGTLGTSIEIAIDGGPAVQMHTSCSQPIGPGLIAGDFEVVSGTSKKLNKPLCPIEDGACPPNQQVTYTYTLTNGADGSPVTGISVNDDKLGLIASGISLNPGQSIQFIKSACLYQTTTNIATAAGMLPSGANCPAAPASETVTLIIPPPPPPPGCDTNDSDSDSHYDGNNNNDSDDSDADSGPQNCDNDDDTPPPPPPGGDQGCDHDFWKGEKHWKSFTHGDKYAAVFGVDSSGNRSLKDALGQKNDNGSKALERESTAALLNAADDRVSYFYTASEVKDMVKNAYNTKDYDTAANLFKQRNKKDCPLD